MTPATETRLIAKAQAGRKRAADDLIAENWNYIEGLARKFAKQYSVERELAMSIALEAFSKAILTKDPENPARLQTYAFKAIQWAVHDAQKARAGKRVKEVPTAQVPDCEDTSYGSDVYEASREHLLATALIEEYGDLVGQELAGLVYGDELSTLTSNQALHLLLKPGKHSRYLDIEAFEVAR